MINSARPVRIFRKRARLIATWLGSSDLPRPLRIARKRLRALGLWPAMTPGQALLGGEFRPVSPYEAWINVNGLTPLAEAELRQLIGLAQDLPRLSIITPVYNTPSPHLRAMAASVLDQVYENWELCFADDASTSLETRQELARIVASDPRIKLTTLEANGGISVATNAAAEIATGEILVFVDHDDIITKDCLAEIALYYGRHPESDIVYSDDDKIDDHGRRYAPQFKPDWSPTLLLSFMYLSHAFSVRRSLFIDVGGFRTAFDGSQDYDFALRASEQARHVGHIPRILYHWRATTGSTALSGDAKPESFAAGRQAVQEALDRRGVEATAVHPDWALQTRVGMFSLRFPDHGDSVTIIIPTYNKVELLRDCLASLRLTTYRDYDVLVVDNGSDDAEAIAFLAEVDREPGHKVIQAARPATGFSFAAVINAAVKQATGEFVLFLNNDTEVIAPAWLSQMMGYARLEGVGSVGAKLHFSDGSLQHGGIVGGFNEGLVGHAFRAAAPHDWGYMGFIKTAREYSAVTAACMLTPRHLFLEMGGFDEIAFAVAYNDVDYGFRLTDAGYRNVYCPDAELFHFEGKTRGGRDNPQEVVALRRMYGGRSDPWYNTNLSLADESFRVEARRPASRADRPVRIAAVSHNLNREGAPNTLFDLMVGMKAAGAVGPIVLAPMSGPLKQDYEAAGIPVILFSAPHAGVSPEAYDEARDRLAGLLIALGAEAVVANTLQMFVAIDAAHHAGLGAIWCQHESEPWETYYDAETPAVRKRAYEAFLKAYRVTYVAQATRAVWAPLHGRWNAQVIRHGIPQARMADEVSRWTRAQARLRLSVKPNELAVILMGTICRRKGQMDLVQALKILDAGVAASLKVFIVGALAETDYAEQVRRAIAALPKDIAPRVQLVGPAEEMASYYAAADIAICTSRIESAPRVIVEAMAFGLPIITTPVFGIPELVEEGVNAVFYEPGDVTALASAIAVLATDGIRRRALAGASRAVLDSKPGYEEMLEEYVTLIREAALLRREPPRLLRSTTAGKTDR